MARSALIGAWRSGPDPTCDHVKLNRPACSMLRPVVWALLALAFLVGCAPDEVNRTYGHRRGTEGATGSVNGTAVLANMFRNAGMRVSTWRRLSPKLDSFDVVVWIPDNFKPPTSEQRSFLERWVQRGTRRTLVYVGRDYDSAIRYWQEMRSAAPPEQAMEVLRRQALAQAEHDARRAAMPAEEDCGWFTMRRDVTPASATELSGPWSIGVESDEVEIELAGRLAPPAGKLTETLLATENEPIVFRVQEESWGSNQIVVVANGSFLLNLPLVNHEHRKLAGRLISECSPASRAVFLESGPDGLAVVERDAKANYPTGMEIFTVWPLGFVMLHLAIAGITLCIACFPIFGRPRELKSPSTSDFGQHISALGELLSQTQDRRFAIERLKYYYEHVRGNSHDGRR